MSEEVRPFPRPWKADNNITKLLSLQSSEYAIADYIQCNAYALSAGDKGVLQVSSSYRRRDANSPFEVEPTEKRIKTLSELIRITDDGNEYGRNWGVIYTENGETPWNEVNDVFEYAKNPNVTTWYTTDTFFKPVYWIPVTQEMVDNRPERLLEMGEHVFTQIHSYEPNRVGARSNTGVFKDYWTEDEGEKKLRYVKRDLKGVEPIEMFIMSEPLEKLDVPQGGGGNGDAIPGMPGEPGAYVVRKPTGNAEDGDGSEGDDGIPNMPGGSDSYTYLGKTWWGSNDDNKEDG